MIARLVQWLNGTLPLRLAAQRVAEWLQRLGVWPSPPEQVADIEGLVERAWRQVSTPDGFRHNLAQNLALAAQRRTAGYAIERPRAVRPHLPLVIAVGLLMASITTLVLALRPRSTAPNR